MHTNHRRRGSGHGRFYVRRSALRGDGRSITTGPFRGRAEAEAIAWIDTGRYSVEVLPDSPDARQAARACRKGRVTS